MISPHFLWILLEYILGISYISEEIEIYQLEVSELIRMLSFFLISYNNNNIKKLNKLNKGREILLYFQDKQRFEKDNITVL